MTRTINKAGLDLIKNFEGLRLNAYQDTGGVWTIGYGHTSGVRPGDTCTAEHAEAWLMLDVGRAEHDVDRNAKVSLSDNQFGALVSFAFNIGGSRFAQSSLLRHLNNGEYDSVPTYLNAWVFDNGKVQPGLVARRQAEAALWSRA